MNAGIALALLAATLPLAALAQDQAVIQADGFKAVTLNWQSLQWAK